MMRHNSGDTLGNSAADVAQQSLSPNPSEFSSYLVELSQDLLWEELLQEVSEFEGINSHDFCRPPLPLVPRSERERRQKSSDVILNYKKKGRCKKKKYLGVSSLWLDFQL